MSLRLLGEMLRIHYLPARYSFSTRYIHYDLPDEEVERLEKLFFVASLNQAKCFILSFAGTWLGKQ